MKRKDKTEIHKLSIPVYQKEERVIRRVLSEIGSIGDPQFSVEENKFKTNLKPKDEQRIAFIRGCLQTLLVLKYEEKEENETQE
jgi:hypothetical protein